MYYRYHIKNELELALGKGNVKINRSQDVRKEIKDKKRQRGGGARD